MGVWNKLSTVFITSVKLRTTGSMKVEFHCRILLTLFSTLAQGFSYKWLQSPLGTSAQNIVIIVFKICQTSVGLAMAIELHKMLCI